MGEDVVVGFSFAALGTGRTFPVAHMRPKNQEAAANFHVCQFFVYFGCPPHAPIPPLGALFLSKNIGAEREAPLWSSFGQRCNKIYLMLAAESKNIQLKHGLFDNFFFFYTFCI
jgi:hypothetical protein